MNKIEAIILDFDGVILESVNVKGWAFGKLFEDYPDHVNDIIDFHYENGGMSRFDKFRYIYKSILQKPLPSIEFERLCKNFSLLVYKRVVESDFVPGAFEFIKKYSVKLSLFIISGTPHDEIAKIVKEKGLDSYFIGVFGSPVSKSAWTRKILEKENLDCRKVLFVGDSMSDYQAAIENCLVFVARFNSNQQDVFRDKKIDYKVSDLFELDMLLKMHWFTHSKRE